jgi:TatD DNase family protein
MLVDEKRQRLVSSLPRDRLLTETDGPFTATAGRPSEPKDVADCVSGLARLYRCDDAQMASTIRSNLKAVVGD